MDDSIASVLLGAEERLLQESGDSMDCRLCYQLLGVDVIFDESLQPYIIEMNGLPSMQVRRDMLPPNGWPPISGETMCPGGGGGLVSEASRQLYAANVILICSRAPALLTHQYGAMFSYRSSAPSDHADRA